MTARTGGGKSHLRNKGVPDFSKVGGLKEHLQLLREIIVLPLIYADLYSHFSIKAPRGILFYGPPGTGKTLVAGALATELSKEGQGKVQFFSRKGADVLDKYVGESERRLRDIFEKAARQRPSIIFFDELDGLAPSRTHKNDHIHSSLVTTLLSLMDGLNNKPGVIVIGATNRVNAIDSALRRPGRFDRELYFPIPCTSARREILEVNVQSWSRKPNAEFLSHLAEITTGYTGSDLQALCSEAFLCCVKRLYPSIYKENSGNKVAIDKFHLKVEQCDFLAAKENITPSTQRSASRMKQLSECVKPLLHRQLNKIMTKLGSVWPHFTNPKKKLVPEAERHIGRVLLLGTPGKGLNQHIVPALLQTLEHLPMEVIDASTIAEKATPTQYNIPSILLISRVHDWWDAIDESSRSSLSASLEDMHPSSPLLIICTGDCRTKLPENLQKYFSNNSALVVHIENPTKQEKEEFFKPLFFGTSIMSVLKVLYNTHHCNVAKSIKQDENSDDNQGASTAKHRSPKNTLKRAPRRHRSRSRAKRPRYSESSTSSTSSLSLHTIPSTEHVDTPHKNSKEMIRLPSTKVSTPTINNSGLTHCSVDSANGMEGNMLRNSSKHINVRERSTLRVKKISRSKSLGFNNKMYTFTTPLTDLVNNADHVDANSKHCSDNTKKTASVTLEANNTVVPSKYDLGSFPDPERNAITKLFNDVMFVTSGNYNVSQLELLYDTISACILINKNDFGKLLQDLNRILDNFENYNT